MNDTARRAAALAGTLRAALGPDVVVTDLAEREACSADLYAPGATCALVLRPQDRASVAQAVASVTRAGFAVIARGGGLTYTGGYTPVRDDNGIGVAGVAPRAWLAGLRKPDFLNGVAVVNALTHLPDTIHVSNNSWGPLDSASSLAAPDPLTYEAVRSAVTTGRGGRGRIFVFAAGNGRSKGDPDCNYDGFANMRFAISVGALGDTGEQAPYSES